MTIRGFDLAQSQYDHAEPDDEWERDCDCDDPECERAMMWRLRDDGPDPDDIRDREIQREIDSVMNAYEQERER